MIDGVTILATTENFTRMPGFGFITTITILLGVAALCAFFLIAVLGEFSPTCLLAALLFLGIGLLIYPEGGEKVLDYVSYTVTIDDTVNFNEFNEKYEILSQHDLLYEIRERTE